MFPDNYPYTNFHELNLGYFIIHFREIFSQWADLYDQMLDWKNATTDELAAWKTGVEADLDQREAALRAELETWKTQTGQDIAGWENATLAALTAWQTATQAVFEAIRVEAAGSATAAAASATDAATAKTAAETAQAAAEAAAASVTASAAQIATNTADISDLKTQLNRIYEYIPLEQGSIAGRNENVQTETRVRTKGFVFGKLTITCNSGIRIKRVVYCNAETGSYISLIDPNAQSYTLSGQYAARIVFGKEDGTANTYVSDVKINTIWEDVLSDQNKLLLDTLPVEQGGIDISGVDMDTNTRVRTIGYIRGAFEAFCPTGIIVFRAYYYNESTLAFDSTVAISSAHGVIGKAGCVSRLAFSKTNTSATILPSDITRYSKSISQLIAEVNQRAVNAQNTADSFFSDTDELFTESGQLHRVSDGLGGFVVNNADLITTNYIPVKPSEKIIVRGRGSSGATALASFYDANYMPVSSVGEASMDNVDTELTVPAGAYFVRVCKETSKTGKVNCLATRRNNNFDYKTVKAEFNFHGYEMPDQTALPDELLATSESFVQADVPDYVYDLYDDLVTEYPNYVSKVNCNTETEIGTQSEYPLFMYKFVPPTAKSSSNGSTTKEIIKKVMVVSGAHDELAAVYGLYLMMKYICEHGNNDDLISVLRYSYEFDVIPVVNPYGLANGVSVDENGVDFERNFKTNDWQVTGTAGNKGYSGTAPLSEDNTQIVNYYISHGGYCLFVDCHNFYESANRALSWIVPPLSQQTGYDLYKFGCGHVKSMTALWKKQFDTTFPKDEYIYGYVSIPKENERGTTDYVGMPARSLTYYGIPAFTVESCETCSYVNGTYDPSHYVRGTQDVMTRVAENIINAVMTILM